MEKYYAWVVTTALTRGRGKMICHLVASSRKLYSQKKKNKLCLQDCLLNFTVDKYLTVTPMWSCRNREFQMPGEHLMHTSSTTNTVYRHHKQCTPKYSYLLSNSLPVLLHKLFALRSLCICRIILVPSHIHLSLLPSSPAEMQTFQQIRSPTSFIISSLKHQRAILPVVPIKCNSFTVQSLNIILLHKQK